MGGKGGGCRNRGGKEGGSGGKEGGKEEGVEGRREGRKRGGVGGRKGGKGRKEGRVGGKGGGGGRKGYETLKCKPSHTTHSPPLMCTHVLENIQPQLSQSHHFAGPFSHHRVSSRPGSHEPDVHCGLLQTGTGLGPPWRRVPLAPPGPSSQVTCPSSPGLSGDWV